MEGQIKPPSISYPEDGKHVGKDSIFLSPNVISPTNRTRTHLPPSSSRQVAKINIDDGIPTPSIYYDDRGEIHNVKLNNQHRINILYTNSGYLRSGDIHPNTQCDFIFSGSVKVWTLSNIDGSTITTTYGKHEFIKIPRGVPHVFEFIEDTVMAEWWEDPSGFECWFYKPYRDIVNKCMKGSCGESDGSRGNERGKQRRGLVLLSPCNDNDDWKSVKIVVGTAVVGLLGFIAGIRISYRGRKELRYR